MYKKKKKKKERNKHSACVLPAVLSFEDGATESGLKNEGCETTEKELLTFLRCEVLPSGVSLGNETDSDDDDDEARPRRRNKTKAMIVNTTHTTANAITA
jgi:hypothetical protein